MPNQKGDHGARSQSAEEPQTSIGAMLFAQKVAAKYQAFDTGYQNELYQFFGSTLISYRKFLKDTVGYNELLGQDNIKDLRQKPDVNKTSRLVLYFITGAKTEAERNTAIKYTRVVDYLHKMGVDDAAAADYVRNEDGIEAILKQARGREALKAADETREDNVQDLDQEEEPDETQAGTEASADVADDLFVRELDISIRGEHQTYAQVLGPEIAMEEVFYLECRKTGPAGHDDVRIVGRLVDWPSE
jgi:hypothetical protein